MKTGQSKMWKKVWVLFCLISICWAGNVWSKDRDPQMTGLPELTEAELQWQNKHMLKVRKVRLNKLGLQRVNNWRSKKRRSLLRMRRSVPNPGNDLEIAVGESLQVDTSQDLPAADMPGTIDNSQLKYFPPVRSQGSLNSCGVFSGVYYTMTYMYALANDLDARDGGDSMRLSPKWAYNMVNNGSNSGSWYYWAYEIGQRHGNATWAEFPYDTDYRAWNQDPETWENALYRRFDQYGYVANTHTAEGIEQVKQMLLNGYILNIPTYISSWKWMTIKDDPATEADDAYAGKTCVAWVSGTSGYHAMTVVGYNDDIWVDINQNNIVDDGEKGAFRIANSWGSGWGDSGFAWMAYDSLKNPSAVSNAPSTSRIFGWYPSRAHWVTAKADYTPKMVGRFTLNHLKRNHLRVSLGSSDINSLEPTTLWIPEMIYNQGGSYGFNGTANAVNGTFVFDMTDIIPTDGRLQTYYLNVQDDTDGDAATLSEFTLIDLVHGGIQINSSDAQQTSDNETVRATIVYNYSEGNLEPVAAASASVISGTAPVTVSFDGAASYDTGGSIVSYHWDFGDGAFQTGASVDHLYDNAGVYTAILTVTDDMGATDTDSIEIEVLPDLSSFVFVSALEAELIETTTDVSVKIRAQILDLQMNPVSNALVDGCWSGLFSGHVSGSTSENGVVEFISQKSKSAGDVIFTVDNITASGYTYASENNAVSSVTQSIQGVLNQAPSGMINISVLSGFAPLEVSFDADESYDPDGTIVSYYWDFGDGRNEEGESVSHIFYDPGVYPVILTVTDDQGASSDTEIQIQVQSVEDAPVYFSNFGTDGCADPFFCSGDLDGDGDVDGKDLLMLAVEMERI